MAANRSSVHGKSIHLSDRVAAIPGVPQSGSAPMRRPKIKSYFLKIAERNDSGGGGEERDVPLFLQGFAVATSGVCVPVPGGESLIRSGRALCGFWPQYQLAVSHLYKLARSGYEPKNKEIWTEFLNKAIYIDI